MTADVCDACQGDSHDNCRGVQDKPCCCGCLPSAASLHQYSLASLRRNNHPQHEAVTRRLQAMRDDGKPQPI